MPWLNITKRTEEKQLIKPRPEEAVIHVNFGTIVDGGYKEVEAALEPPPTIGAGNVRVSGADGGPFNVEFQGALAITDVAELVGDKDTLMGGSTQITEDAVTAEFTLSNLKST